jgi:RNA polymerase sigma-70 factor, ECF subfamily
MSEVCDRDVLALLEQRDPRGFDLAYERYAQRIFGFLFRLSRSRALAEDLFQHTFMRLAEVGARLGVEADLRAWLFSVARNAFHSHARWARVRHIDAHSGLELFAAPGGMDPTPDAGLALGELERALMALSEPDRELLLLFGVEGLSHAEVAKVLVVDEVTVRKRLSRARARLAEALDGGTRVMPKSRLSQ